MQSKATTVAEYLAGLPDDRREAIGAVRRAILKNLDKQYEEGMQYGMIGYYVPHRVYPAGYHCDPKQPLPFAGLASQKNHMAVYLMCLYLSPEQEAWFREAWANEVAAGRAKKLDMGKSCIRFKRPEDISLGVIGEAIRRVPPKKLIAFYEASLAARRPTKTRGPAPEGGRGKSPPRKASPERPRAKSASVKKTSSKASRGPAGKKAVRKP